MLHLSFIPTPLSSLQKFPTPWLCTCVMTCMRAVCAVSPSEDPQSSFHELQSRLCSQPAPSGSITLVACETEIRICYGGGQRFTYLLLLSPKRKVITPHCQNPHQRLSWGFKPRRVPFPSNISIALCCTSKWNQKLLQRKRKVIFFSLL